MLNLYTCEAEMAELRGKEKKKKMVSYIVFEIKSQKSITSAQNRTYPL